MINDDDIDRAFLRFEFQAKLLFECGEERWAR